MPPAPGIIPSFVSGRPIFETAWPFQERLRQNFDNPRWLARGPVPATRKSHASASSNPPPRAGPSIAAIVGIGRLSSLPSAVRKSVRNLDTWPLVIVRRSARSAPEQNEPGVEEFRMSTRTELSRRTVSKQSASCWVGHHGFSKIHSLGGGKKGKREAWYLEHLKRDCILCVWAVQGEGGDTWMGPHRLKKGFMGVKSREEPPGRDWVPLGNSEERRVDE